MTENKRFTDIEHDFENARIRCKDNGMFMLYAIYEDGDGLPTLGGLLNNQEERIQELEQENKELHFLLEQYENTKKGRYDFEKYCPVPMAICEFGNKKVDCENCDLNKRYGEKTIDNWETYIVDRKTGKEYGNIPNNIINLLNEQDERIQELENELEGAINNEKKITY